MVAPIIHTKKLFDIMMKESKINTTLGSLILDDAFCKFNGIDMSSVSRISIQSAIPQLRECLSQYCSYAEQIGSIDSTLAEITQKHIQNTTERIEYLEKRI